MRFKVLKAMLYQGRQVVPGDVLEGPVKRALVQLGKVEQIKDSVLLPESLLEVAAQPVQDPPPPVAPVQAPEPVAQGPQSPVAVIPQPMKVETTPAHPTPAKSEPKASRGKRRHWR